LRQHPVAVAPQLVLDMDVGDGNREVDDIYIAAGGGPGVVLAHAAPGHQAGVQAKRRDSPDGIDFSGAHGRDADFDFAHADFIEHDGNGDFFVGGKGDTGSLFAVAKRGVVDGDHTIVLLLLEDRRSMTTV
jgi:hypothetical protein